MNQDNFSRIGDLRQRVADLQHQASLPDVQIESLIKGLGELSAGLQGLARAEQELRAVNVELTAACRAAEAERQRTQDSVRALREERDRFKAVAENTHTQLAYLDSQFNFVWVNPGYVLGSGHSEEELLGRNHFELFPNPENQAIFEQAVETGQAVVFQARPFEYADQPERGVTYWDWTLVPIKNGAGQVEGLVFSLLEVTEQERAEAALRESEETARALLNAPTDIVTLIDTNGVILDMNETMVRRFDQTAAQLLGTCVWDLFPADVATSRKARVEQVVQSGKPLRYEDERQGIWNDNVLYPIVNKGGKVDKIAVIARDITEHKRVEELLREQNEFITLVFESLAHPFYVVDVNNYEIKMANSAAYRGELPAAVTCYALTHGRCTPCNEDKHQCPIDEIQKTRQPVVMEHIHHDGEGQRKIFEVHGHPIFDREGAVTQIIEYTLDVTERRQAEVALEESEERYRLLVETMADGLVVVDEQGEITYVNDGFCAMVEYSRDDLIGRGWFEFVNQARQQLHQDELYQRRKGEPGTYETILKGKDGDRVSVIVSGRPLYHRDGSFRGSFGVFTDITARKRAEEALQERTYELGERVKELNCLFAISALVEQRGISLEEILRETVELLPPAWQYPEITGARITFRGQEFRTEGFSETAVSQQATDILVNDQRSGTVEVCYLEERPAADEGPFLKEERSLINTIAERLGRIAEQLRAQAVLRESEEKWRSLTEYSPDHIMLLDRDANIRFINHSVPGLSKEQVIGTSFYDYALEPYRQVATECFEGVLQTGNPDSFESIYQFADGSRQYFESLVGPVRSDDKVVGLTVSSRNITDRKQMEEALARERDFTAAILDTAGALVVVLDPQGRIVRFNRACERLTGYSFDGVEGARLWNLFLIPEEVEPVKVAFEELRAGNFPSEYENYWVTRDGSRRLIAWSNTALVDATGSVEYVIGTGIDITETRQAEQAQRKALQESRQREAEVSALLQSSRAVLSHRDFEPAARSIFDSCKRLTGASAGYVALLTEDGMENEVLFLDSGGHDCTVDPTLPMPIRGLREQAYASGATVYENGFAKSEWVIFLPHGHVSLDNALFAPLVIDGKTAGLLGLANKPGGFTENDAHLASAFGELAAIALLNSRTLESLQNSTERFHSVAQTAGEAIVTVDSQGKITFWNKAAEIMFGYAPQEVIGQQVTLLMPDRFRTAHQNGRQRVVTSGQSRILGRTVEMIGLGKDGSEFPIELSLSTWKIKEEVFFTGLIKDITERRQAQEQIQSLARFPNENRSPVLRVSRNGTILYANASSAPVLAEWNCQVGQQLPEKWHQLAVEALRSDKSLTAEVMCQECIFSLSFAPVHEAGYVNLYGRDVTERQRAEEALRASEKKYRQLVELAQEGVWVIDTDSRTTFVNPRMAEMLGYTVEEMQGAHLFSFMDDRGIEISKRNVERRQRGIREQHDFELMRKDGTRIYTSMETSPIMDEAGNYAGALALVADITERRQAEDALSTLLQISHQVALTVELEPLLNLILDQLKALVDYDDAMLFNLEQESLSTLAHRGAIPHEQVNQWHLALEHVGFARRVIFDQETVIISDVQGESPLARDFREVMGERLEAVSAHVRSWMGMPLTVKDQVMGILALQHSEPERFTPRQVDLVSAFANQAAVAIENNRLYEQAQALAAVEERQRLARDLHDAVSQTLFSASLAAEVLPRLWERKPDEGRRCLEELRHLTRSALAEMRTLLLELRPTALAEVELGDLLRQLVEAVTGRARLPVTLTIDGKCSLAPDVHVTLYRIAQEALSNVTKHAGASRASVSLRCIPPQPSAGDGETIEAVELCIEDNGHGFDLQSVPAECMGLCIMQERADTIGAAIRIESQLGHGTQVVVKWRASSS